MIIQTPRSPELDQLFAAAPPLAPHVFNDHPFPVASRGGGVRARQRGRIRWDGLSEWMEKGLDFWFASQLAVQYPAAINTSNTSANWQDDSRVGLARVFLRLWREKAPIGAAGGASTARRHTRPLAATAAHLTTSSASATGGSRMDPSGGGEPRAASIPCVVDGGMNCDTAERKYGGCRRPWLEARIPIAVATGTIPPLHKRVQCCAGQAAVFILRFHSFGGDHRPWMYNNADGPHPVLLKIIQAATLTGGRRPGSSLRLSWCRARRPVLANSSRGALE